MKTHCFEDRLHDLSYLESGVGLSDRVKCQHDMSAQHVTKIVIVRPTHTSSGDPGLCLVWLCSGLSCSLIHSCLAFCPSIYTNGIPNALVELTAHIFVNLFHIMNLLTLCPSYWTSPTTCPYIFAELACDLLMPSSTSDSSFIPSPGSTPSARNSFWKIKSGK